MEARMPTRSPRAVAVACGLLALWVSLSGVSKGQATTDEKRQEQPSTGLKPLTEMTADDRYKGEDGGLYGGGKNEPPKIQQDSAQAALKKITPLDAKAKPSA